MSLWSDLTGALSSATTAPEQAVTIAGGFFRVLTDGAMWRSVAWILLGAIMLTLGLLLLFRAPVERGIGTVAKAAAL